MLDPFHLPGRTSASLSVSAEPDDAPAGRRRLPLNGQIVRTAGGWAVRIPLSVEEVSIAKEVMVSEEIHVAIRPVSEIAHITGSVRREQLHVDTEGELDETRPLRIDEMAEIERRAASMDPDQSNR